MADEANPLDDAPPEVLEFLQDSAALSDPHLRINVLETAQSREYSAVLHSSSVGRALGLVALIDANDSNPHCYIGRGIGRGMVVHFSHDPEPEIHFADFESFRTALATARERDLDIDEIPREPLKCVDSDSFGQTLEGLARLENDYSEDLICLFVPLLSPTRLATIETLSGHNSFFVREAVARFIAMHPRPEHGEVAARLAADRHPQVSRLGQRALNNVKGATHASGANA